MNFIQSYLFSFMPFAVQDVLKLKDIYENWTDIDMIVGGIAEIPQNAAIVGPTYSCIMRKQKNVNYFFFLIFSN